MLQNNADFIIVHSMMWGMCYPSVKSFMVIYMNFQAHFIYIMTCMTRLAWKLWIKNRSDMA